MQGTVISLRGSKQSGKTTAIRLAYEELLHTHGAVLHSGRPGRKDVMGVIVVIKDVKIGFASHGDRPGELGEALELLVTAGCRVIVCATHPGAGRAKHLQRLAPGYRIEWIEKAVAPKHEWESRDKETAKEIVEKVLTAVRDAHQEA
jgi:hypothetical protein